MPGHEDLGTAGVANADAVALTPEVMEQYMMKFSEYNLVMSKMRSMEATFDDLVRTQEKLRLRNDSLEVLIECADKDIADLKMKLDAMEELLEDMT